MKKATSSISLAAAAAAVVLGLWGIQSAPAAEKEYKLKAKATSLIEEALPGVDGKTVIIKHFTIPPGFVGGKHFHPGPVYVYVLEGALSVETDKGIETVQAGQLYKERIRSVMRGKNLSASEQLEILVFQVGDRGKPMMIKAN